MAVTENLYTGNGSSTNYSFTFPYLETTDIKVSINGTITTAYTLANPTTIQFTTAPANGAAIRIYRVTDDSALAATFYSGAAIRATDLNENFTQNLYVTQESNREATTAITTANSATSTANTALSTANAATVTANAASASAASAVSTAASAVSTANSAVSTANAASASAASAVATANTANTNATAALNAAAEALAYVIVANVAAIPASPVNGDAIRVTDSTGIESFTPLSGKPVGFVGEAGLTVEIYYSSSVSSWVWVRYYATDADARYLKLTGGTLTGQLKADDSTSVAAPVYSFDGDTNTGIAHTGVDELALVTNGVARLTFDSSGNASFTNPVTIPAGSTVTDYLTSSSAASTYLTQSNAASTYQTQAGMSSYVPTSAIGTTVQSYDADTAKTDVAQTFTAAQRGAYVTLTDAATIATDLSLGNQFQVTLGGNRTLGAPTNVVAGQSGVIRVVQDGTGSRTLAYNSVFKFPGGTAPTLTTTANAVDLLAYHVESTTRIAVRFIGDVK
jgi:hypothetical protein